MNETKKEKTRSFQNDRLVFSTSLTKQSVRFTESENDPSLLTTQGVYCASLLGFIFNQVF